MNAKKDFSFRVRVEEIPRGGWTSEGILPDTWLRSVLGVAHRSVGTGVSVHCHAIKREDAVEAGVSLNTRVQYDCSRCAESRELPLFLSATALFVSEDAHRIRLDDVDDIEDAVQNVLPIQGGMIDLEEVAVDMLATELSPWPLCSPDCKGLCIGCGADLNHEKCRCDVSARDTRFAALANWKQNLSTRDKA